MGFLYLPKQVYNFFGIFFFEFFQKSQHFPTLFKGRSAVLDGRSMVVPGRSER